MSESAKARYRGAKPSTTYKAPTEGLSHVVWIPGGLRSAVLFEGFLETGILQ